MSITTHILDTSKGKPAAGIKVILFKYADDEWQTITGDITNNDGRITNLFEKNATAQEGIYKLKFETKEYFHQQEKETFYPFIEIIFEIKNNEHYHVPLLLNPFGYTTYRGS